MKPRIASNGYEPFDLLQWRILPGRSVAKNKPQVICTISCESGEGSSSVALGLAHAIVRRGRRRVLLVDANIESPSLCGLLETKDMSDDGSNGRQLESSGRSSSRMRHLRHNLDIVSFTAAEKSRRRLFHPSTFQRFVERTREHYSVVIIDCPALRTSSCTPLLGSLVDGAILVIQANRLRYQVVRHAVATLQQMNVNVLGVVLNKRRYPIPSFIYRLL